MWSFFRYGQAISRRSRKHGVHWKFLNPLLIILLFLLSDIIISFTTGLHCHLLVAGNCSRDGVLLPFRRPFYNREAVRNSVKGLDEHCCCLLVDFNSLFQETAWVFSGNEISQICFIFALPFLSKIHRRTLWTSVAMVLTAFGLFLCASPFFAKVVFPDSILVLKT